MKYIKTPEFVTAICFFVFLTLGLLSRVSIENVEFVYKGQTERVSLPFNRDIRVNVPFKMEFDVSSPLDLSYDIYVIPDDCAESISVEGFFVDLSDNRNHCNFSRGFNIPDSLLNPHRLKGKTHYSMVLKNKGGPGGAMFFVKMTSVIGHIINFLTVASLALFFAFVARRLRFGKTLIVLLFLGMIFRSLFFVAVPYKKFSMDVEGHIQYVQYIIENHAIPGERDCWSCYHPSVYYIAATPSYLLGEFLGTSGTVGLQGFSLLLSLLTTFVGLLFLRKILEGKALILSSILWIFWPLMIMVAPRIGNDQLFYLLHVVCMWCGINYFKEGRGRYLIVAVVTTALALWTKTTAVVTLGMLLVFLVAGYFANSRLLRPSKSEWISWAMTVVLLVVFLIKKVLGPDLVGNIGSLNSGMKVPNEVFNYLYFDLQNFLQYPFTSCWNSSMGRDYFWNFALKTSMFGEWDMLPNANGHFWATIMSALLLGLVVYAVRGFWKHRLSLVHWILMLHGVAFVAALMALRIKYPYACSNDFRYILPVLLSFCPFVAWGIQVEGGSLKWKVLGYALVAGFALSTTILYILAM